MRWLIIFLFKLESKFIRLKFRLLSNNAPQVWPCETQPVLYLGKGLINIDSSSVFGYSPSPFLYSGYCHIEARNIDSIIEIGSNNYFNNNFCVIAESGKIHIGSNCLVGVNVTIINSDFHPISICDRHARGGRSKDVIIGDNVFIGNNVTILKGVHIGDNSVIANGSVVFNDVKDNTVVRGNPAEFYIELYD